MANTKISSATDIVMVVGTDKIPLARAADNMSYYATVTEIKAFVGAGGTLASVTDGSNTISNVATIDFTSGGTVSSGGTGIANVAVGGGAGLVSITVSISQSELTTFNSSPVALVAAPGAGKKIALIGYFWQYKEGTSQFPSGDADFYYGESGDAAPFSAGFTLVGGSYDQSSLPGAQAIAPPTENVALVLSSFADAGVFGPITSSVLNSGGALYAADDTGIVSVGGEDATYIINTVDGGGAVLTYTLTAPGNSYTTTANVPTETGGGQPGVGTGFTLDITVSVPGTGTGQIDLVYKIIDAIP